MRKFVYLLKKEMKVIVIYSKLHGYKEVFVDDEDFDDLNKFKWYLLKDGNTFYACRSKRITHVYQKSYRMHRVIMKVLTPKTIIDHIDMNGLNNQKKNLRICTQAENLKNRKPKGVSIYLGVTLHTSKNKFKLKDGTIKIYENKGWLSHITVSGKCIHLGKFKNEIDAAKAYDEAAKIHHKEFANLNFK